MYTHIYSSSSLKRKLSYNFFCLFFNSILTYFYINSFFNFGDLN